ncbi:MAG: hypothetical protein JWO25_3790 [Alphaproteobacteria bacterium]|nr:hypothetical protein [Alphaproteobacteria bacterium]MDB5722244.1 hypothetical protein [Alphaproteobacteria bacterium]
MKAWLAPALLMLTAASATPPQPVRGELGGTWINPHNSVAVRTGRCGDAVCGWIIWVNSEAAADARDSGVANPIGTEVLRDYRPAGDGSWRGTVFVVDMGRTFSSRIVAVGAGKLKISGCLLGTFLCKSQIWRRS